MDDEARYLLPAYAAGSLAPDDRSRVERAVQGSPALLAEAMELALVNEHLLSLRAELDAELRTVDV
jgi:hypothetical protein